MLNGLIAAEKRATRLLQISDPQTSVICVCDSLGAILASTTYWPYGQVMAQSGASTSPYRYCGSIGYYLDSQAFIYVRARHLDSKHARWLTVDKRWPTEPPYGYSRNNPVTINDPSGYGPGDAIVVPLLCIGACIGAVGCGAGIWYACKDWYPGYKSFAECAQEFLEDLPPQSVLGCGLSLGGCLACLIKYAPDLCKKIFPGDCTPAEWEALTKGVHAACDSGPSGCDSRNKNYPKPPLTREKMCAFLLPRIANGTRCLAARLARQLACYAVDQNPVGHWKAIHDTTVRLGNCVAQAIRWGCIKK